MAGSANRRRGWVTDMAKLGLSVAMGDYDRTRPLVDGSVRIDGVDPTFLLMEPEEIFFRAFRHAGFDICELSLSSFTVKTAAGTCPYVGVPVFLSRAFRHSSLYIRTDRGIRSPADLRGKLVGIPEYQLTANVWMRAILQDEHGVAPADIDWLRGGMEQTGRVEKIPLELPADVRIRPIPENRTLSAMLQDGEIDAIMGPRAPSCFERGHPQVAWLYPDPRAAASEWFARTRIFPIMHVLGIRRELVDRHAWLPATIFKAFERARRVAMEKLVDTSTTKVMLPFVDQQLREARDLMGEDFWSYGIAANRHVLETFLRHHYAQGLSSRRLEPEELFHPSTLESARI